MLHVVMFSPEELALKPTLAVGHTADLKLETDTFRYWLNRGDEADGHTVAVEVEELQDGRWVHVYGYGQPRGSDNG